MKNSVRAGYQEFGVEEYYRVHSEDYTNPHEEIIDKLLKECIKHVYIGTNILDLCCGSGEVTRLLSKELAVLNPNIVGLDPFTAPAYNKNTNKECLIYDFKDIVNGALENYKFHTVVCSFAMHLCDESMLNSLLYQLSRISDNLIIITPHKRPEVNAWWKLIYKNTLDKVTIRVYNKHGVQQ